MFSAALAAHCIVMKRTVELTFLPVALTMLKRRRMSMPQSDFMLRHSLSIMTPPGAAPAPPPPPAPLPPSPPRRRGRCSSILAKDASDGDFLSPAAAAAAAAPPCSSLYSICARAASSAYQHRPAAAVHSTYLRYCAKYSPIYKRSCYVNVIEQMHYHVLLPCEQR